jgi:hypothetical protein
VKKTFLRGGEVSERRRGWLPYWGFCSKNVRTSFKKHRQNSEIVNWRYLLVKILTFLNKIQNNEVRFRLPPRSLSSTSLRGCGKPKQRFFHYIYYFFAFLLFGLRPIFADRISLL